MAYTDPSNANWQTEDDSVEGKLPSLLDPSNPLMKQAQGQATATANRRGLQNSSIAAGEGEKAMLSVAVPIASQDASQTSQKNLAAQGFGYNTSLQTQQIAGQKDIAGMQTASNERVAASNQAAQLQQQLAADAAAKDRLGIQLTSDEQRAKDQNAASLQVAGIQSDTSKTVQGMSNASAETVAAANRAADTANNNRTGIDTAVANANNAYTNTVNAINDNKDMPADARAQALADADARQRATISLVEQVHGVTLDWPPAATAKAPAVTIPQINL